jgi:hypothetical protein
MVIVLACLIGESEEAEEDKCTDDHRPTRELDGHKSNIVAAPNDRWNLIDSREVRVCILPPLPGLNTARGIDVQFPRADGDGAEKFDPGKTHETEVTIRIEVAMGRQELLEFQASLGECTDSQTCDKMRQDKTVVEQNNIQA